FELDAAFESIPLIDVGERARLHIRIRNEGDDLQEEMHVEVRADQNVQLVSASPWRCSEGGDDTLVFTRAPLLRGENCEIAVDAYALRAGESTIAVCARSAQCVRELALCCACDGAAAFAACANRLELCATEAEAGAEASGRLIVTNTGNAAALVQPCVEGLDAVRFDPGPSLEVAPAERVSVAFCGRFPLALPDGSQLEVRAFLTHGNAEAVLGTAAVAVRSRPSVKCRLEERGKEWLVCVSNDGANPATLAIAVQNGTTTGLQLDDLAAGETIVLTIAPSSPQIAPQAPQRLRSRRAALEAGTLRQLQALTGFVRHLWAIAVLCADCAEDGSADRVVALRTALRSVFDRLVIKLRMPQYPLHADDVLDRPARDALCALGAAASADLPSMLDHAASFIEGEREDVADVCAYRTALRARLCALRDDGVLIAALTGADSELDALLDAMLAARVRMTA
ncbi:MAG: hypothetical protein ACREJX_10100, partial [Polyangiaceae bacterium]